MANAIVPIPDSQIARRRACLYGQTPDARARLHMLSILFRRSDERFERRLSESCRPAGKWADDVCKATPPSLAIPTNGGSSK